jgi:nitroreductase
MKLDETIESRHSVRRYSSKKPKWQDIIEAVDAANRAPMAGNTPTLRYILVDDAEKIEKIAEASQQDFVNQASYVVVVCSDKTLIEKSYGERARVYSRQQAGAAVENFLLKITDLGLASCWVGAFVEDMIKNILAIPENIDVEVILPVGLEMPPEAKRRRKTNLDNILFFNKWKNKYMKPFQETEPI